MRPIHFLFFEIATSTPRIDKQKLSHQDRPGLIPKVLEYYHPKVSELFEGQGLLKHL